MGERTAFFYGTLMAPEILYRVCYGTHDFSNDTFKADLAASLSIKPAILHEYCRHRVEQADYPGIIPEKGHTVRGTYVTGLTEHDVMHLDAFEGSEYRRRKVKVVLLKPDGQNDLVESGGEVQTETYVFTAGFHRLEKEEWDYEVFRKEKLYRWVDQSVEYEEVDELAANGHDPTGGRGVHNGTSAKLDEVAGDEEEEVLQSAV